MCGHSSHPAAASEIFFGHTALVLHICGLFFCIQGLLTKDDQNALESSAVAGDVVIKTAFAVALHSQDLDYLSALFKDIASNRRDSPQVPQHAIASIFLSFLSAMSIITLVFYLTREVNTK